MSIPPSRANPGSAVGPTPPAALPRSSQVPDISAALNTLLTGLRSIAPVAVVAPAQNPQRRKIAEKLAPSTEAIQAAMSTLNIQEEFSKHGLEIDPKTIREKIIDSMASDPKLPLEKLKQFPILAGFVGLGLIKPAERDWIVGLQNTLKKQGTQRRVGDILRDLLPASAQKACDAANQLLTELQKTTKTS